LPARRRHISGKWAYPVSRFLTSVDRENGSMSLDPFEDYPSKTYLVFEMLQNLFSQHIKKKTEEAMKKSKGARR
jgi:hypothetical protein